MFTERSIPVSHKPLSYCFLSVERIDLSRELLLVIVNGTSLILRLKLLETEGI